jgi:6-phosphogluconolactonase
VVCITDERIAAFTVGTDGQLTANGTIGTGGTTSPRAIVVDPSGKYLYTANLNAFAVGRYSIGSTGTLTSLGQTVVGGGFGAPSALAVSPNGKNLYASLSSPAQVFSFSIDADGGLTSLGSVANSNASGWFTVDSAGKYAYGIGGGVVAQFSVDASTGALTPLSSPTVAVTSAARAAGAR